jgi:hypothetical protein
MPSEQDERRVEELADEAWVLVESGKVEVGCLVSRVSSADAFDIGWQPSIKASSFNLCHQSQSQEHLSQDTKSWKRS